MALPKDKFGYYGLRVEQTFDEVLDAINKPVRIPLPDRAAKRKAFSLFRNAVLDNERMAMGYDPAAPGDDGAPGQTHEQRMDEVLQGAAEHEIRRLEHALGGDSIPASILQVQPSPSADDAVFADGGTRQAALGVEAAGRDSAQGGRRGPAHAPGRAVSRPPRHSLPRPRPPRPPERGAARPFEDRD